MSRKKSHLEGKNLKKIGERFELLRLYLHLNQINFAKLLGIAPNSYSDIKRGIKGPTMPVLLLIEHRYGISPDQILTGNSFSLDNVGESRLTEGVQEAQAEYTPKLLNLLEMAKTVLESKTEFATALAANIQAFFNSLRKQHRLEDRLASLEKKIENMEFILEAHTHSGIKR